MEKEKLLVHIGCLFSFFFSTDAKFPLTTWKRKDDFLWFPLWNLSNIKKEIVFISLARNTLFLTPIGENSIFVLLNSTGGSSHSWDGEKGNHGGLGMMNVFFVWNFFHIAINSKNTNFDVKLFSSSRSLGEG
jgi:hypothetical protein